MELTEVSIEQMNELIARFMGYKKREKIYPTDRQILEGENLPNWYEDSLEYHTSWDWLMPVVEKIESLYEGNAFTVEIKGSWCLISQNTQHWMAYHDSIDLGDISYKGKTKLQSIYQAVYKFIQWYNQQINKPD